MTIKEGYLAKLKTYPQDEIKIVEGYFTKEGEFVANE